MKDDLRTALEMLGILLFVALLLTLAFALSRWAENTMRDAAVRAVKAEYGAP